MYHLKFTNYLCALLLLSTTTIINAQPYFEPYQGYNPYNPYNTPYWRQEPQYFAPKNIPSRMWNTSPPDFRMAMPPNWNGVPPQGMYMPSPQHPVEFGYPNNPRWGNFNPYTGGYGIVPWNVPQWIPYRPYDRVYPLYPPFPYPPEGYFAPYPNVGRNFSPHQSSSPICR